MFLFCDLSIVISSVHQNKICVRVKNVVTPVIANDWYVASIVV
jgi:hypothetical protein